jgi:hypothetical protein
LYPRQSKRSSLWLAILAAVLLVFGAYYVWHGVTSFFEANGNIAAPATDAVQARQTQTIAAFETGVPTLDFLLLDQTKTPERVCYDWRVKPLRARVRECPNDSCGTVLMPAQGDKMCVYGPAPSATGWYEVNMNPDSPLPQVGYMHGSVIEPINPTKTPTKTFTPLPTVTPVPSATQQPTGTPPPTNTSNPAAPATWTLTPTVTPRPPVESA